MCGESRTHGVEGGKRGEKVESGADAPLRPYLSLSNAPSSFRDIGISVQQKLLVSGFGRTGIGGNQFALLSLVRVLHIIQPCFQALGDCLALVDVHRYDAGSRHCYPPDCRKTRPSEEKRVS